MKYAIPSAVILAAILVAACTKPAAPPKTFPAKADSHHQVGTFNDTEKVIRAVPGQTGAVVFGPYVSMEPGRYSATFDVTGSVPTAGTELGAVDVSEASAINPENILAKSPLKASPSPQKITVEFSVASRDAKYEYRVWSNGVGIVEFRGVQISALE